MNFDKAYDLLDNVRERLETTIPNSSVDLMPSDTDDFFITVIQRNETTGSESKWSFCVDFGTNTVQMLEPVEDEESFRNDNEIFSIIKNFLNGGMSREKRMNRPDYDSGEPIKITGFGNKIGSSNKTVVRQGPNLKTLNETPAEHIMKNLDAYKGYTRYDMEQLVLNPSGYTLYDGDNRKAIYKKDGAEDITLLFRNGELKNAEIKSSRKPIKSSLSDVNKALGFTDKDIEEDGRIHITTDFGEFVVDYVNDEYIVTYDGEERTFTEYKDTVEEVVNLFNKLCNEEVEFFDKNINSSKSIKSSKTICKKGSAKLIEHCEAGDCGYLGRYTIIINGEEVFNFTAENRREAVCSFNNYLDYKMNNNINNSRKPIKSDFNPYYEKHPDTPVGYLLGGEADTVTDADKKAADEYGLFYEGYGTMDGTEKGHLFIGEYQKLKSYFEDYMGHSLADDYIYPYEDSFGEHILDRFEIEMTWFLPTEKDYQDIVNKLNEYVDKEYGREFGTGSIYHFNMYKGEGTNTDGYGHEYPNYIIFDTEGNLDLFSGDEIVRYIDNLLAEKGWYHEAVSGSDNFTIAVVK